MARPRKPAALRTGHHANHAQLQHQIKMEKFLGGGSGISPEPPKELNDIAKWYYRYIVTAMKNSGVLVNLDRFVVVQTAVCLSRLRQCDKVIDQQGLFCYRKTKRGGKIPFPHPAVSEKKMFMAQFKTLATQLGLTPSSRSKLASVDAETNMKKQDPIRKILDLDNAPKSIQKER